jgi:hypothetical protein
MTIKTLEKQTTTKNKKTKKKHTTHETKDGTTGIPLNARGELWCSGRVSSSCSTYEFRRITLDTKPVISHTSGKDR